MITSKVSGTLLQVSSPSSKGSRLVQVLATIDRYGKQVFVILTAWVKPETMAQQLGNLGDLEKLQDKRNTGIQVSADCEATGNEAEPYRFTRGFSLSVAK